MIYVLYGPGGSGKSRIQVQIVADKLRKSRQNVSTNLALDVPRLAEYLEEKYPLENLNVLGRVRVLTEEETKYFWRYRGPYRWKPGTDYDLEEDKGASGCCFIIDEAGAAGFSAKAWAAMGDSRSPRGVECAAYLDQQRKYSDDVYFSTNGRNPNRICKDVRDVAHYFIKLRNEYLARYGMFRGRGRFVAKTFDHEPGPSSEPIAEETFTLDAQGLASCYRTEQGVGVSGVSADKGARAQGISIWWAAVAAAALVSLIFFIPQGLGRLAGHYLTSVKQGAGAKGAPEKRDTEVPSVAIPVMAGPDRTVAQKSPGPWDSAKQPTPPPQQQVWVRGYVMRGNRIQVLLTDGRTLTQGDGVLRRWTKNFVELTTGERVYMLPSKPVLAVAGELLISPVAR